MGIHTEQTSGVRIDESGRIVMVTGSACPNCSYLLEGLAIEDGSVLRCPECDTRLYLGLMLERTTAESRRVGAGMGRGPMKSTDGKLVIATLLLLGGFLVVLVLAM
ncbi:MAG: hypothetical protein AAF747_10380 [Planctomycetota bacterium]